MKKPQQLKSGEVSFFKHKLPLFTDEKGESSEFSKECTLNLNKLLDSSNSPARAMEFLSRPWSSSSSDFQQIFSDTNLFLPLNNRDGGDEQEEIKDVKTLQNHPINGRCISTKVDKKLLDFNNMKGWLSGKSLTKMFRSNKEKKREETRLHSAKLHSALSLTQLAAAIAGFAAGSKTETRDLNQIFLSKNTFEWDQDMGVAVASGAALLTTVFAEAAESLGAKRTRVASAVKSGLATQTPIDMMTITATAATSLRGAAALNSRAIAEAYFPMNQLLKFGAQISLLTPSGDEECRWVTIDLKQRQIMLIVKKKFFRGAFTASRAYKVINVMDDMKDSKGCSFVSLITNKGIIKLLFHDEKQSIIWTTTISNLLQMHISC